MNIAVYCSAKNNIPNGYFEDSQRLGKWIGENNHTLVYGGLEYGLMDTTARAVKESGGKVIGVVPQSRLNRQHPANTVNIAVATLHERKQTMEENADVFVALEGGIGTIDEIMSALANMTFTKEPKPILLLNRDGIYTPLRNLLNTMETYGLATPPATRALRMVDTVDQLIDELEKIEATNKL